MASCSVIMAAATEKPKVGVAVQISANDFTKYYKKNEISALEQQLAREMALIFNAEMPFFAFRPGSIEDDILKISIISEAGQVRFTRIRLMMTLSGKNIRTGCGAIRWDYIPAGCFFRYAGPGDLVKLTDRFEEVYTDMGKGKGKDNEFTNMLKYRMLVEYLDRISVQDTPPRWILPYRYSDLPIGSATQFLVYQWHKEREVKMERIFFAQVAESSSSNIIANGHNVPSLVEQVKPDDITIMKKKTFGGIVKMQLVNVEFIINHNRPVKPSENYIH